MKPNTKYNFGLIKRHLNAIEANLFAELLQVIGESPPNIDDGEDTRRWGLTKYIIPKLFGLIEQQ